MRKITAGTVGLLALVLAGSTGLGGDPAAAAGVDNLAVNASFEQVVAQKPSCWEVRGSGAGTATLASTSTAHSGSWGAQLSVTGLASGASRTVATAQNDPACVATVQAGRPYTAGLWFRSSASIQLQARYRGSDGVWNAWVTSPAFAASSVWAWAAFVTPAVPTGANAVSFGARLSINGTLTVDDALLADASPALAGTQPFADSFDRPDGLVTNEYAYWNPTHTDAVASPAWEMTSGSLFAKAGTGYSGVPDRVSPNALSTNGTDSAVFRLNTKRADFGDVRVGVQLNIKQLSSTTITPAVAWDGIHIWLRYQSQYNLYYASVARRDGRIVIKKKCPGGPSNDGTYYELSNEVPGYSIPFGQWRDVGATVTNNADGTVTITLLESGRTVLAATDSGVGCAAITHPGAVGIRGDNAEFQFDNFTAAPL